VDSQHLEDGSKTGMCPGWININLFAVTLAHGKSGLRGTEYVRVDARGERSMAESETMRRSVSHSKAAIRRNQCCLRHDRVQHRDRRGLFARIRCAGCFVFGRVHG
jgi:hypothetical protein